MKKYIILTESGADVPLELAKLYNIQVVPMHVIMENKSYADGSIQVTDLYEYYKKTKKVPSTSAANPNDYLHLFEKITKENPGCIIIHIGYSSKPSCAFQNSIIASDGMENVYHVDALNVTGGLGAIALKAAEIIEKQPDIEIDKLIGSIESYVARTRVAFVPGNLEYLRAGGRVSNAAYLGGVLLQIKPLIEILDGELVSTKKYRGKMENVAEKLIKEYLDRYDIDREQIYLLYSLGLEEHIKKHMEDMVKENGFRKVTWVQAGCVITAHCGPGAVGIAGFENIKS